MDQKAYRDAVLKIYQAVPDPSQWQKVLDNLCDTFSARGCIIFEWQLIGANRELVTPWFTSDYDPDILADYLVRNRHYEEQDQDIFERQLLSFDGIEVIAEDVLYEEERDYRKRPHVKELNQYGVRHRTGSLLDKDNPFRSRFSLQLSDERGPLDTAAREDLVDLLPHLAKAMEMGRPLMTSKFEKIALQALSERVSVGICILDRNQCVVHANAEFERQIDEYEVFRMDRHNRLSLNSTVNAKRYFDLAQDVSNHGKYGARPRKEAIALNREDSSNALCLEIAPVHSLEAVSDKPLDGTILMSRDTTKAFKIDTELFRQVFSDLTIAESAVAELVSLGLTNAEIADRRGRSIDTINSQVKSILDKTRAANRTQLVRLLVNYSL